MQAKAALLQALRPHQKEIPHWRSWERSLRAMKLELVDVVTEFDGTPTSHWGLCETRAANSKTGMTQDSQVGSTFYVQIKKGLPDLDFWSTVVHEAVHIVDQELNQTLKPTDNREGCDYRRDCACVHGSHCKQFRMILKKLFGIQP